MEKLTILILLDKNDEAIAKIKEVCPGAEVRIGPHIDDDGQVAPAELMKGVDVLFCEIPPDNFDDFDQLKWIQLTSAGYSQVLDLPILERGILVSNGRGNFDIPIAEWNIAMMVNIARDLRGMIRNQEAGFWERPARFQREIHGSLVGLYGYGGIARETARLCKAFGMTIYALDAQDIGSRDDIYVVPGTGDPQGSFPDKVFKPGQEKEFLSELDFLVMSLPLTKRTEGLVGEEQLKMLPSSAFVLNPARGPLIQEEALLKALREEWIAGLAIDTHYYYPMPADHPLWRFPNVIMTPHISGSGGSPHFTERFYDICVKNLKRYCAKGALLNELTESQLKGE